MRSHANPVEERRVAPDRSPSPGTEFEREAQVVSRGRATRTPLMALVAVAAAVWLVALVVAGIVALIMWLF
jgi:hypothetical protein